MSDCSICFDPYNKSSKKQTSCPYCNAGVCRSCVQQFLLMDTATDPVCPSCRAAWSYEFLTEVLTNSFRTGLYKAHRERVLLDRERARLPETQEQALAYKSALEVLSPVNEQVGAIRERIRNMPAVSTYTEARKAFDLHIRAMPWATRIEYYKTEEYKSKVRNLDTLKPAHDNATKKHLREIRVIYANTDTHRYVRDHYGILPANATTAVNAAKPAEERRAFVRKCPADGCEGFLSQNLSCGLCNIQACKDCHEIKSEDHVCDPAIVETMKALAKEAKPCPKCSSRISKIDGCDQMWCTQCKTAFSWRTGAIETSVVHNPHYFQWMRESGLTLARQPGDIPCNIRTQLYAHFTTMMRQESVSKPHIKTLFTHLNNLNHLYAVNLRNHRQTHQELESDEWRRILRVKRMVNNIDDAAWKTALQKKEKALHKERAMCQLLDMYTNAGYDILAQILDNNDHTERILEECEKLKTFTQDQADRISKTYACVGIDLTPIRPRE